MIGLENFKVKRDFLQCEVCAQAKMKSKQFDKICDRASRKLEIIHADIMYSTTNLNKFICSFVDNYSCFGVSYIILQKS